jgi:signal transduction histidine kinase
VTPPPPNVDIHVDRVRMAMALTNVVNNAIRFTPDGGTITIATEVRAPNVLINISDNGIGFTKDQTERIFEKFYQVEDHMTRKHGGLGIGLSISRALVEAHGGHIWAQSPGLNQGATFTIAIPLAS